MVTQDKEEKEALRKMKQELTKMPHCKQSALVHARRTSPNLVDDGSLLMFLQAESFDARCASQRLAAYWEARFQLFGPVNCFLPMTLDGAMRDSLDALSAGYMTILPCTDKLGRPIVYSVSRNLKREYFGLGQVRVWWYLLHLLMENSSMRKRGYVILSNAKDASMDHFDTCSVKGICFSGEFILPIRYKMCHICHSNPIIPTVSRIVRTFLSVDQRAKVMLHNGSTERVLESLTDNHMERECLPIELGGKLNIPPNSVIRKLVSEEGSNMFIEYQSYLSIDETNCTKVSLIKQSRQLADEIEPHDGANHSDRSTGELNQESFPQPTSNCHPFSSAGSCGVSKSDVSESMCGSSNVREISTSSDQSDKNSFKNSTESCGKKRSQQSKANRPGRLGDPRMNRAVQAKLDNPDMPLITALVRGGFVFPDLENSKGQLSLVKDIDNVTGKYMRVHNSCQNDFFNELKSLKNSLSTKESAIAKIAVRKAEDRKEMKVPLH